MAEKHIDPSKVRLFIAGHELHELHGIEDTLIVWSSNTMTKKEITAKIKAIYLQEGTIDKILDSVFSTGLSNAILENFNGSDPLDTVVSTVIKIIEEVK